MEPPQIGRAKLTRPSVPVTSPEFHYTPAAATDVTRTWARFGWIPPTGHHTKEQKNG